MSINIKRKNTLNLILIRTIIALFQGNVNRQDVFLTLFEEFMKDLTKNRTVIAYTVNINFQYGMWKVVV